MGRETFPDRLIGVYIAAGTLFFVGWGGIIALILYSVPAVLERLGFFVLGLAGLTGTAVPFMVFLSQRFGRRPISARVLMRRAIWVGAFGVTLAWLQLGRTLTWSIALLLVAVFVAIEWFVELRARSLWDPDASHGE
jgi:hypothetical protein